MNLWIKSLSVTIQMKATEQHFLVVLFIMLYKVILTLESVDEILRFDHSNESHWSVLFCFAVYNRLYKVGLSFESVWNPEVWPFKWKLLSNTFSVALFILLFKVDLLNIWGCG